MLWYYFKPLVLDRFNNIYKILQKTSGKIIYLLKYPQFYIECHRKYYRLAHISYTYTYIYIKSTIFIQFVESVRQLNKFFISWFHQFVLFRNTTNGRQFFDQTSYIDFTGNY